MHRRGITLLHLKYDNVNNEIVGTKNEKVPPRSKNRQKMITVPTSSKKLAEQIFEYLLRNTWTLRFSKFQREFQRKFQREF